MMATERNDERVVSAPCSYLHVRKIELKMSNSADDGIIPGVLGIQQTTKEGGQQELVIQIATETNGCGRVFEETVTADDETASLKVLKSYLVLSQPSNNNSDCSSALQNSFQLVEHENDDDVRLLVSEETASGLVLTKWTRTIPLLHSNNNNKSSLLITLLADMIQSEQTKSASQLQHLKDENETLTSTIALLEQGRDGWKDTATKLSGELEREKTALLNNFLKLYNERGAMIQSLQQQVQRYDKKEKRARGALPVPSRSEDEEDDEESIEQQRQQKRSSQQRTTDTAAGAPTRKHILDDQDEVMPDDLVAKLAAGPGRNHRQQQRSLATSSRFASQRSSQQQQHQQQQPRGGQRQVVWKDAPAPAATTSSSLSHDQKPAKKLRIEKSTNNTTNNNNNNNKGCENQYPKMPNDDNNKAKAALAKDDKNESNISGGKPASTSNTEPCNSWIAMMNELDDSD